MCGVGTGSMAGMDYQEKNKKTASNNTTVKISVVFSPYTYDFLKNNANWNYYPTQYFDRYVYLRFMTRLKWSTKPLLPTNPQEFDIDKVPAMSMRVSNGPDNDHLDVSYDKFIFIDCTTKEGSNNIVKLDWDSMIGYLSFAFSEIKDFLFRLHKYNYRGKVKFVVTGFEPLDPLIHAFCYQIGISIKNTKNKYQSFCNNVNEEIWFANFKRWLQQYNWDPELEEAALFEGNFYGGSEETISSRAMKIKEKFRKEEKKLRPYWKGGNGLYGQVVLDDAWITAWKRNGGASTDRGARGENKPIYHYDSSIYGGEFGPDGPGMTSAWNVFDGDEEPLGFVNGKYYTYAEIWEAMNQLDEIALLDNCGPKWWIGRAPRGSKRLFAEDMLEYQAEEMQKNLDYWKEHTYEPQKLEYNELINSIDARHKGNANYNATEEEIWNRKSIEDESVSDKWNAGIDDIEYHGKTVNRSYLKGELDKLEEYKKEREAMIRRCKNDALLIRALKVVSCIQFMIGMISLGSTSSMAIGSLLIIDSLLETTKVMFEWGCNDDLTLKQAFANHLSSYINNAISALVIHVPFKKYTTKEINRINSMGKKNTLPAGNKSNVTAESTSAPVSSKPDYRAGVNTGLPTEMASYSSSTGKMIQYSIVPSPLVSSTEEVGKMAKIKDSIVKFYPIAKKQLVDMLGIVSAGIKNQKANAIHFLTETGKLSKAMAKEATFLYTAYSAYSNAVFVFNRKELTLEEVRKYQIDSIDSVSSEDVFNAESMDKAMGSIILKNCRSGRTKKETVEAILKDISNEKDGISSNSR